MKSENYVYIGVNTHTVVLEQFSCCLYFLLAILSLINKIILIKIIDPPMIQKNTEKSFSELKGTPAIIIPPLNKRRFIGIHFFLK